MYKHLLSENVFELIKHSKPCGKNLKYIIQYVHSVNTICGLIEHDMVDFRPMIKAGVDLYFLVMEAYSELFSAQRGAVVQLQRTVNRLLMMVLNKVQAYDDVVDYSEVVLLTYFFNHIV